MSGEGELWWCEDRRHRLHAQGGAAVLGKAVLLAAGVLALAGCGSPVVPKPTPSTASSSSPSSQPSPSPSPTPPILPCPAATTDARMGNSNSAAGHLVYAVVLTNTGLQTCTLDGYPTLTLMMGVDPLPTTQMNGNDGITSVSTTPTLLTIPVGGSASFVLQYSDVPTGSEACNTATYLQVQLPGGSVGSLASAEIQACGGVIYASPFRSGTSPP